jgi:hypothetical protein
VMPAILAALLANGTVPAQQKSAATLPATVSAQQKLDIDPLELVRRASKNEIKASSAEYYCIFKDTTEYKDHSITKEIVRTPQGGLSSTLLINGHPLTAEERRKDDEKLQKFANNPDARRKRREANASDDQRSELMLSSLPDAFLYTYAGTDHGPKGEELVHLNFRPNQSAEP